MDPHGSTTGIERLYFVIPAYNEALSIAPVIAAIRNTFTRASIIVVNDGSRDNTSALARAAGASVIDLPYNCGYGVALHTGLIEAYRRGAELVVTQDADGQHDAAEAIKVIKPVAAGEADIALGSRYLENTARYKTSILRRAGSSFFARLVSWLTGIRLTDPTTGFQCLNRRGLGAYAHLEDFPERTPDADLILYAHRRGFRIKEAAVVMYADAGNDSMHGPIKSLGYLPTMLMAMAGAMLATTGPRKRVS